MNGRKWFIAGTVLLTSFVLGMASPLLGQWLEGILICGALTVAVWAGLRKWV